MEGYVGLRRRLLVLAASVLVAAPVSVANQDEVPTDLTPGAVEQTAAKAIDMVFTDGFESGDTSAWSNGTAQPTCETTLVIPTGIAD